MGRISFWSIAMILIYWRKLKDCKEITGALLHTGNEVGLKINTEKNNILLLSWSPECGTKS